MFAFRKRLLSYFCKKKLILNFNKYLFLFNAILFFISSCVKHESVLFKTHSVPTKDEINSVLFKDVNHGIAIGGNRWSRGIVCRTSDSGLHWVVDSVYDKELFCLSSTTDHEIVAMGIELILYHVKEQETIIHKIKHDGTFRFIKGISAYDSNTIMAVHALNNGSIEKFSLHSDSTQTVLNLNHELKAIQCIDSLHWLACGYGIVLKSNDTGVHWDTLNISGDDFVDINFISPGIVYILGSGGTVLRSLDSGNQFQTITSSGIIGSSPVLRCIAFKNAQEGLIAGDDGFAMRTRDGGLTWIQLDGLPIFDIKNIYFDVYRYWLCGTSGMIISIE
jgi:photosystem II stability/assembly factor-like uncharacterized protein